jgi:hypothetical protein
LAGRGGRPTAEDADSSSALRDERPAHCHDLARARGGEQHRGYFSRHRVIASHGHHGDGCSASRELDALQPRDPAPDWPQSPDDAPGRD